MINPATIPSTNAVQLPAVRGVRQPQLGVKGPRMPRYKPAKGGGFGVPKVPSIAPQA